MGVVRSDLTPQASATLVMGAWLSVATVAAAALIVTGEGGLAPGLREAATAHLDVAKQDLGLARLVDFIALAYLVAARRVLGEWLLNSSVAVSATPFKA